MIRCAIYPRKSKVVEESDSMEVQIDMCLRYLNDKYGEDNYIYTVYGGDYGVSGHSVTKRKDFQRMMQDVKSKKIQLVVIQRFDRIARNTRDFCNLYHDMEVSGCELISVSQQIDTTTPYGRNFMYMQASMAELEWALCSERRKDANKYAIANGKCIFPNHSLPIGYKAEVIDGVRKVVKDPEKEDLTIEIFSLYKKYKSFLKVSREINLKYNIYIQRTAISKMIKNPMYYGTYKTNNNYCPAYITKEQYDDLQRKVTRTRYDDSKKGEILFAGLLRCPICGRILTPQRKSKANGKYFMYYMCYKNREGACTNNKVKSELLIESQILEMIEANIKADITIVGTPKKVDNSTKIAQIEKELDRLNKMYLKGRISEEKYDAEYYRIEQKKNEYESQEKEQRHVDESCNILSKDWLEVYQKLDKTHKRMFWRDTISQIILDTNMCVKDVIFL